MIASFCKSSSPCTGDFGNGRFDSLFSSDGVLEQGLTVGNPTLGFGIGQPKPQNRELPNLLERNSPMKKPGNATATPDFFQNLPPRLIEPIGLMSSLLCVDYTGSSRGTLLFRPGKGHGQWPRPMLLRSGRALDIFPQCLG